jgi:hypothetical protein
MKVVIQFGGKKNDPGEEYEQWCHVFIGEDRIAQGGNLSECPEDANLGRDLKFVYGIPDALRLAYEAGKAGEPFDLVEQEDVEL